MSIFDYESYEEGFSKIDKEIIEGYHKLFEDAYEEENLIARSAKLVLINLEISKMVNKGTDPFATTSLAFDMLGDVKIAKDSNEILNTQYKKLWGLYIRLTKISLSYMEKDLAPSLVDLQDISKN